VLASEYVAGEKITVALDRMRALGDEAALAEVLGTLLSTYVRQVLVRGAFQADPHPGNFLVTARRELVLLDFGCMQPLADKTRRGLKEVFHAGLAGDRARLGTLLAGLGFETRSGTTATLEAFAEALLAAFQKGAASGTFAWPTREELFAEARALLEQAEADPITRIPGELVLLGRVFGTLGGLFQHYQPRVDWARHILPHLV
jgi:ubiquinone biosynthesis protein